MLIQTKHSKRDFYGYEYKSSLPVRGKEVKPYLVQLSSPPVRTKKYITICNCQKLEVGDVLSLKPLNASSFVIGEPDGGIMTEDGMFHDDEGLQGTTPNVSVSSD